MEHKSLKKKMKTMKMKNNRLHTLHRKFQIEQNETTEVRCFVTVSVPALF